MQLKKNNFSDKGPAVIKEKTPTPEAVNLESEALTGFEVEDNLWCRWRVISRNKKIDGTDLEQYT